MWFIITMSVEHRMLSNNKMCDMNCAAIPNTKDLHIRDIARQKIKL